MRNFGSRLQLALSEKGISKAKFAEELGVTTKTVSLYIANKRIPDVHKLYDTAIILSTSTDWLLGLKRTDDFESYIVSLSARQRKFVSDLLAVCQEAKENQKSPHG